MKSIEQKIKRAEVFFVLWNSLLPEIEAPPREQLLLWVSTYDGTVIERGITRAASKFRTTKGGLTANECYRYATSVMHKIAEELRHRNETKAMNTYQKGGIFA